MSGSWRSAYLEVSLLRGLSLATESGRPCDEDCRVERTGVSSAVWHRDRSHIFCDTLPTRRKYMACGNTEKMSERNFFVDVHEEMELRSSSVSALTSSAHIKSRSSDEARDNSTTTPA